MAEMKSWTLVGRGQSMGRQRGSRPRHAFPPVRIHVREEVRLLGLDRGEGTEVEVTGLRSDDVVELCLGEGMRWWMRVEELAEAVAEDAKTRGAPMESKPGRVELPASLGNVESGRGRGRGRGAGRLVFEGLRLLDVDLAEWSVREIAEMLEDQLDPGPGLYFSNAKTGFEKLTERVESLEELPADERSRPYLILLHGTASSTYGSFSDLESELERLERFYGKRRILAFEHRTLTRDPAQNARDLLQLLPADAELHLLSHSRGGLVGELLCRGSFADHRAPFTARDLELFRDPAKSDRETRPAAVATLESLGRLLAEKRPRITRFVRVACPAKGTLLASDRLDRSLALLVNALKLGAPAVARHPIFEFLQTLVVAAVKKRTDSAVLPGLAAMKPTSPWIRLLNLDRTPVEADLSVVAGDVEGGSVLGRLAAFALDRLIFRQDHDLIVHTEAMYGGSPRPGDRGRAIFERGPDTTHFSYFRRRKDEILRLLTQGDSSGFHRLVPERPESPQRGVDRGTPAEPGGHRPVAVVLPGILGSHLTADGNRVWVDLDDLAFGGFAKLAEGAKVQAGGVIGRYYDDLMDFLSKTHDVVAFDFDWRLSIQDSGRQLAKRLDELLSTESLRDQPIRIVAHSMGGLVAQASAFAQGGDELWQRLRARRGFRFLMLGTPSRGSHVVPQILFGRERMVRRLALLDVKHSRKQLLGIFREYQGLYDLLPSRGERDREIFKHSTWRAWKKADHEQWPEPKAERLKRARKLRERLEKLDLGLARDQLVYVAGQARATPTSVDVDDRGRLTMGFTDRGDGRVLWETGPPEGAAVWWTDAVHGRLPRHRKAFPAYLDLLEIGRTTRLRDTPPATRGAADRVVLPGFDVVDLFPSEDELVADAVGDEARTFESRDSPPLAINVTHGDLRFARHPVLVGHYEDDALYGVEDALDSQLGGLLRRRYDLGVYPGAVETAEAFLDSKDPHNGAIVVGLGRVGELSPGMLEEAVTCGALRYAVAAEACGSKSRTDESADDREIALSALLVGSGEGGIGISASLRALVDGVRSANRRLEDAGVQVHFTQLEMVELFEQRALRAAHALRRLAEDQGQNGGRGPIAVHPTLRRVDGGARRIRFADDEWWQRLRIAVPEEPREVDPRDRPLIFTTLGDRARAEQQMVATRRRLLEDFVADAVGTVAWDEPTATTLFELLLPNDFKSQAQERRNRVLVVDRHSGVYPWELLHDAFGHQSRPLAVQAGLIRQLATYRYRRLVDHPTGDSVLVVGDPPSKEPPLPGAQREAEAVATQMAAEGWTVEHLDRPSPRKLLTALFSGAHRVLHIAAHGKFDPERPTERGIVIGTDKILTPGDLRQMRKVPELVFVNCCHLGRMDGLDVEMRGRRNDLAANIGIELIEMGVRAVVATGWVVDDAAAAVFAEEVYQALLDGQPFGIAVRDARQKTYDEYRDVNTWGAYQCYGDPSFRLRKPRRRPPEIDFGGVDPLEAEYRLENLTSQARVGRAPGRLAIELRDLQTILERKYPAWLQRASVRSRLGEAFGELADLAALSVVCLPSKHRRLDGPETVAYEEAIRHFQASLAADRGSASLDDPRRMIALEIRFAVFRWKYPVVEQAGTSEPAKVAGAAKNLQEILEDAEIRSHRLLKISATVWRQVLLGFILRNQARLAKTDQGKCELLEKAAVAYRQAHHRAEATFGRAETYPALSWCMTQSVHDLIRGTLDPDHENQAALGTVIRGGLEAASSDHSFWRRAAPGDAEIIQLLVECTSDARSRTDLEAHLESRARAAFEAYESARQRGGSPRQFHIVIETLDWIVDLLAETEEDGLEAILVRQRWQRSQARQAIAGIRRRFAKTIALELAER